MSSQSRERKDTFFAQFMDQLCEISHTLLDEEIPERDLGRRAAKAYARKEEKKRFRCSWLQVALVSGFAAAGSAAFTGVVVFACTRHSFLKG